LNFIEPRVAAGALFFNSEGHILMVVPTYKDYRDIPGGYVENGETPTEAVRREVFEELGIKPNIGRLLVVDWWSDSPENNGKAKLLFVFDGGRLTASQIAEIRPDPAEIGHVEFHPLDAIEELTIPRLANRIRNAHAAHAKGSFFYLEEGLHKHASP